MRVVIESESPAQSRAVLLPGQEIIVGRSEGDIRVVSDVRISARHFLLGCDTEGNCFIRDLDSTNGTFRNGDRVREATILDGDRILAGRTTFIIHIERQSARLGIALSSPGHFLRQQETPVFAILDSARDPEILPLLRNCQEQWKSLYEGKDASRIADFGPYLVALPKDSPFLEELVAKMWGKSWGIFISSASTFESLRRHLSQFLKVEVEDNRSVYFRFYDPRVLRLFLPTCDYGQALEFFGQLLYFVTECESEQAALVFRLESKVVRVVRIGFNE